MTRVVVIGGSGHVGSYLIPLLVQRGFDVINISRGNATPYHSHSAWRLVKQEIVDRKAEEAEGRFGARVANLKPDIVIDMIAFEPESAKQVAEAIKGKVDHYLFCSTIWVYGHSTIVPTSETEPAFPIDDYGKKKLEIERYLMSLAKREGFPATSFRPGHIVGEGWTPVNPQGNLDLGVYEKIAHGVEVTLPNIGLETLNHVHADDVARWVMCAIDNRAASIGECFNTVASQAVTMRGYCEAMYRYFGQEPKIAYVPLEQLGQLVDEKYFGQTRSHVTHSPCAAIEKSRIRLGYTPRYTSLEAIEESVEALVKMGKVTVPDVARGVERL